MNDPAWYRTPSVLLKRPLEFFPARSMSPAERLNSMVRFVLYASAAIAAYRQDVSILGIGCIIIFVLSIVFSVPDVAPCKLTNSCTPKCTAPTPSNPFMNVLTNEFSTNKPDSCGVTTETMKQAQAYFDAGLPREISDVYHNRASDRQFITMPVSGNNGTPDTLAFRNYLYSRAK